MFVDVARQDQFDEINRGSNFFRLATRATKFNRDPVSNRSLFITSNQVHHIPYTTIFFYRDTPEVKNELPFIEFINSGFTKLKLSLGIDSAIDLIVNNMKDLNNLKKMPTLSRNSLNYLLNANRLNKRKIYKLNPYLGRKINQKYDYIIPISDWD